MSIAAPTSETEKRVSTRANELFAQQQQDIFADADRFLCAVLALQYGAAVCTAVWVSPLAWAGSQFEVHLHVRAAVVLGAAIVSLPICMGWLRPGRATTRHVIAVGQMLMGALLIHLAGGRIETHFHVFASLALLSVYRDWRVLISASLVVAVDHFLRGLFWTQSVYGVLVGGGWRWVEHSGWVVVEDLFLIYYCVRGVREMKLIAARRAELEETNTHIEEMVRSRTSQLAKSEARFRTFVDHDTDAFFLTTDQAVILDVNEQACTSLGRTREELIGTTPLDFDPELTPEILDKLLERLESGETVILDTRHRRKDWSEFPVEVRARLFSEGGQRFGVALARDITERRRAEQALSTSQKRYADLVNNLDAVVWEVDAPTLTFRFVSHQAERVLGYPVERWLKEPGFWVDHIHPDDRAWVVQFCMERSARGEAHDFEYRMLTADGRVVWLRDYVTVEMAEGKPTTLRGVMVETTTQKKSEEALHTSIREKEALLKEIHHRVKNNLQIVSSLLNLQLPRIKDAESLAAFQDSQNRVYSMALIHETLYRSGNLASVRLADYVATLCSILFRSYGVKGKRLDLVVDVAETSLDLDRAIPCGLIINELVSNSLKYAFPEGRSGRIEVRMQPDDKHFLLSVSDDGVGLPAGLELEQLDSLGLNLVSDLTGQIGGTLQIFLSGGWRKVSGGYKARDVNPSVHTIPHSPLGAGFFITFPMAV